MECSQLSQDGGDPSKIVETIFKTDSKVKPMQQYIKKKRSDLLETMISQNIKKLPIPGTKDYVERKKKQKKGKLDKKTVEKLFLSVVGKHSKLFIPFSKKLDELLKPSVLEEEELKFPKKKAKKQSSEPAAALGESILGKRKHDELKNEDDDDNDDDDDDEEMKGINKEQETGSLSDDDGDIFESNKKKQKVADGTAALPQSLDLGGGAAAAEKVSMASGDNGARIENAV